MLRTVQRCVCDGGSPLYFSPYGQVFDSHPVCIGFSLDIYRIYFQIALSCLIMSLSLLCGNPLRTLFEMGLIPRTNTIIPKRVGATSIVELGKH